MKWDLSYKFHVLRASDFGKWLISLRVKTANEALYKF